VERLEPLERTDPREHGAKRLNVLNERQYQKLMPVASSLVPI